MSTPYTTTIQNPIKLKNGTVVTAGQKVTITWPDGPKIAHVTNIYGQRLCRVLTANLHKYFPGFTKPPTVKTMNKWMNDGIARTVLGQRTEPDGEGTYGEPSWLLALNLI